eukprot:gene18389-biopygen20441
MGASGPVRPTGRTRWGGGGGGHPPCGAYGVYTGLERRPKDAPNNTAGTLSRTGEKAAKSVKEQTVVHVEVPDLRSAPGASTFLQILSCGTRPGRVRS